MHQEPVDLIRGFARFLQREANDPFCFARRKHIDLSSLQRCIGRLHCAVFERIHTVDRDEALRIRLGIHLEIFHIIAAFYDNGARAVPEQDTACAVFHIHKTRKRFAAAHEKRFAARLYEPRRRFERKHETRTRRIDVKADRFRDPELPLDLTRNGRHAHFIRHGRDDDAADIILCDARLFHGYIRCDDAHILVPHAVFHIVAALDARTFCDPFVRRIYDLFKVLIGHHFFRQIAACSHDAYTHISSYFFAYTFRCSGKTAFSPQGTLSISVYPLPEPAASFRLLTRPA